VVYYSLAANLTAFVTSVHGAMISVIMPSAASMGAKKDKRALGRLLLSTTRYGVVILILTSLPLVLGARALLTLWVGASYAGNTAILLQLLVIANFVRHIGAPYAIIALAVGEQRKIILSPVIEAIVNLTASVIFTAYYGVIGVAIGTLCGAFVSIGMHFMHNLPRTMSIEIKNSRLLLSAVFVPLASVGPSVVMMAAYASIFSSIYLEYIFLVVANVICWLLLWKYGVSFDEKTKIMVAIYGKINVLQRKL
jgi:O-antigen/teichoic acid export membrane protein